MKMPMRAEVFPKFFKNNSNNPKIVVFQNKVQ